MMNGNGGSTVAASDADGDKDPILQATHGSSDHPLRIGDISIPCYVLADGRRVVVLGGMLGALDISPGTAGRGGGNRLTKFISSKSLSPFIPDHVADRIRTPLRFRTPMSQVAYGYEATILPDICDAIVEASKENEKLNYQLRHIVVRAQILQAGFARVGIIALVDEATGYQEYRAREALEEILQRFISEELMKWVKTFPDEFYRHLFRLYDWKYLQGSSRRPGFAGKVTNDIIYERLAPGVLDELRKLTPKDQKGRRRHRYFQRLTTDIGHPKLREHLSSVITLMRVSPTRRRFYSLLNRALPKYDATMSMFPDYEEESD
jgi:hypothetical protein